MRALDSWVDRPESSLCVAICLKIAPWVAEKGSGRDFSNFCSRFFRGAPKTTGVMEENRNKKQMGERSLEELNALIEAHLPLVKHVVFQVAVHFPRHVDREELARAGALGLVEAARRYDDSRGVPFDRFAAQRIRGSILDSVRAADWAPRSVRLLARRLEAAEQHLASELGRLPSPEEMAGEMGISKDELTRLQDRLFRSVVLALDHETSDDTEEDLTLVDLLQDRSAVDPLEELETRELHAYLRDAVKLLPERQRLVIVGYFLEGRTSQELARFLGVTESRVSQLRSEALSNLKLGIESQYDTEQTVSEPVVGRVAKRQAVYSDAVSEASRWQSRLDRWDTEYDVPEDPLLPVVPISG